MPENPAFADKQLMSAKQLMSTNLVKTAQDDVGAQFRIPTTNTAIITSWPCPSNEIMVESVEEMRAINSMSFDESHPNSTG